MALIALIFVIVHLGIGFILPYRPGFLPFYYRWMEESGFDFERRLNRPERPQSVRVVRGIAVGLLMGILSGVIGYVIWYAERRHGIIGICLELLLLSCCVTFMTPMKVVREIQQYLAADQLPRIITELQPYVPESLQDEDIHTIIRKTIEFIAVSLNQFLLAPVFWFIIAGPIGLLLYVTYSALRHSCWRPDGRRRYFGSFVRGIDTILNIIPAAISTFFLTISALFVSRSNPWRAVVTVWRQSRECHLVYRGWLIAALAGGLGVTLGGPVHYNNPKHSENYDWVGPPGSSARLMPSDLSRAALLQYVFFMCVVLFISVLMILKT